MPFESGSIQISEQDMAAASCSGTTGAKRKLYKFSGIGKW
jgi:hypothetical protein